MHAPARRLEPQLRARRQGAGGAELIVLLRHARAGERAEWDGDDRLRPLDEPGRRQAHLLVEPLAALDVRRIVSSPYVRCTQTVEPLAAALGLAVEVSDALAEGAPRDAALAVAIGAAVESGAVLCTHGDVVEALTAGSLKKGAAALLDVTADGTVRTVGAIAAPRPPRP